MNTLRAISDVLLITGGLAWGVKAVTNDSVDPIDTLTGGNRLIKNVITGTVGVAALYTIYDNVRNGFPRSAKRMDL